MNKIKILGIIIFLAIIISSCKNKEEVGVPAPVGNEFLTTTILKLQNLANLTDTTSIRYQVIGSNPVQITPDSLLLKKNAKYNCTVVILDVTKSPVDTVSIVVKQRANYHLFFFYPTTGLNLSDTITDHDSNIPSLPLGLTSVITTGNASIGTLQVILRHQPNVKNGTYAPGSTDLDVFFPVKIK
jgi:hypothetical protein